MRFIGNATIFLLLFALTFFFSSEKLPQKAVAQVEMPAALSILPLGDSITQGNISQDSYRRDLYTYLQRAHMHFDLVGSQQTNREGSLLHSDFDLDHEGHWGWRTDEVVANLPSWIQSYNVDIALIHLGSNDAFQNKNLSSTIVNLESIIDTLRQKNPHVVIVLAQIIPTLNDDYNVRIKELNARISLIPEQKWNQFSKIIIVDQSRNFDSEHDTYDGVHPNNSGESKMAWKWFETIQPLLMQIQRVDPSADDVITSNMTLISDRRKA